MCLISVLFSIVLLFAGGVSAGDPALAKSPVAGPAEPRPNIILFIADDLGYGELGCQGNSQIPTPHIDALSHNGVQPVEEHEYLTDAFTREALSFLERHRERPFFLQIAYNAVHSPMQGANSYMEKFTDIEDIQRRIFAAMLANMDSSVGSVMEKIKKLGLEENTLVIFLSDNGGPTLELTSSNLPLRGGKGTMYEGGNRIPFIMQWKERIPAGTTYDQVVSSLDIFPTCVTAAGASQPDHLDGVDLIPYLTGKNPASPHDLLFWRQGSKTALRKGDWKIFFNHMTGDWELYNLGDDIGESNNLITKHPGKATELKADWEVLNSQMEEPLFTPGL